MMPHPQPKTATRIMRAPLFLAIGGALLFLATLATAQPPADPGGSVVTVDFADDDMGFNATSSKDISNIYVVLCDESLHKHDDLDGHYFNHTEDQKITGVYVKSGNNGIEGNDPPGAGEFFPNDGVDCGGSSTTSTSDTETTGSESQTETEEIPVFGTATTLALGIGGALGGALLMLRRKL